MSGRATFRASRFDLLRRGVPEDYVDALLDDEYMERLLIATNKRQKKRQAALDRYQRMNMVILIFLICQAVLGVWVALYKTLLQPDTIISANVKIENVDMVLMVDASRHMTHVKEQQHQVITQFTAELQKAMEQKRQETKADTQAHMQEMHEERMNFFSRLLSKIFGSTHEDHLSIRGGQLRFSTSSFNSDAKLLHDFTKDLEEQKKALKQLTDEDYSSNAHWMKAMTHCKQTVDASTRQNTKRYCILIGDNEAMCQKPQNTETLEICKQPGWEHLCPEDIHEAGDTVEYAEEIGSCTDYVAKDFGDLKLIMMFTVGSPEEEQLRLRNPSFRNFVKSTTDCDFEDKSDTYEDSNGYRVTKTVYKPKEDTCLRFIMATGLDDLLTKSQRIAELLKNMENKDEDPNLMKDNRYLFFLLLPLNLVFYLLSSFFIRLYDRMEQKAAKAMGKKKKMIKVTKTLVEKPKRSSIVDRFAAKLTEVELAEVSSLRPPVEFETPHTLRARLKGACLHQDAKRGVVDGNGSPFDPFSYWTFSSLQGDAADFVQGRQAVLIKNSRNELMRVDEHGTSFVPASQATDTATHFFVNPTNADEDRPGLPPRLGDTVRIMSRATGNPLRVKKDGTCDGMGNASDVETQFVIDRGGQTVNAGSLITLRATTNGEFLHATPDGAAQVYAGGDDWSYWWVDKVGATSSASSTAANPASGTDIGNTPLKVGDVVTLKSFNKRNLEVGPKGICHCGDARAKRSGNRGLDTLAEEESDNAQDAANAPGIQQFVIERVGMGLVTTTDTTIRKGAAISLKPYTSAEDGEVSQGYLQTAKDGAIVTKGKATGPEIGFIIDVGSINRAVSPLAGALSQGDVDLLVAPLWNKGDVKHLDALSSSWTNDEELSNFKGAVVVADDKGHYVVPKAKGQGFTGWVAVVTEGVDLRKAAAQAKKQGATGLIVRCEQALSLDKLQYGSDDPPELPAVFVNKAVAEALNERGITLKGCEFRKKYMTEVMRSLGNLGATSGNKNNDVQRLFEAVGTAMMERNKEKIQEPEVKDALIAREVEDTSAQGNFKWKVNSNTHYLWSSAAGGKMAVNYGKAAPPSAQKFKVDESGKVEVDASADKVLEVPDLFGARRSVVGVTHVTPEDFKRHQLSEELSEVILEDQDAAMNVRNQEQLADESDFMIEYNFTEVEVAVGAKQNTDDAEEDELMEEGAAITKIGVPRSRFWIIAVILVVTTTALALLLHSQLTKELDMPAVPSDDDEDGAAKVLARGIQKVVQRFLAAK